MSESDMKINAKVRKILVENHLDLSLLSVSTTSGTVTIRGEVKKLFSGGASPRKVAGKLGLLESAIMRVGGVKRIHFRVEDWQKTRGKWEHTGDEQ